MEVVYPRIYDYKFGNNDDVMETERDIELIAAIIGKALELTRPDYSGTMFASKLGEWRVEVTDYRADEDSPHFLMDFGDGMTMEDSSSDGWADVRVAYSYGHAYREDKLANRGTFIAGVEERRVGQVAGFYHVRTVGFGDTCEASAKAIAKAYYNALEKFLLNQKYFFVADTNAFASKITLPVIPH